VSPDSIPAPIAVAIPCYNEAPAIGAVVGEWRAALPEAEVVVFDNNSTDGTAEVAREAGARIVRVPLQGKGEVVRAIFRELAGRQAVVMIDGDGTYPASAVGPLLRAVLDGEADMAVGARVPVSEPGAMSPVRGFGNLLIRVAFRTLIGPGTRDLLSGYRVFSGTFVRSVPLRSSGFEIETELNCQAIAHGLRTVEFPVPYHPRHAGTASKLRAFRDGRRILRTIVQQSIRLRPARLIALVTGLVVALALIAGGLLALASRG
jgi:glycosyltransferase involved in cell wall biosynthesis